MHTYVHLCNCVLYAPLQELQLCLQRERAQHQHQLSELEATRRDKNHHTTHSPEPPVSDPVRDRGGGQVEEEEGVSVKMSEAMGYGVGGSATRESDETANVGFSLVSALDEVNLEVNGCDVREKGRESLLEAQLRGARSTCEGEWCVCGCGLSLPCSRPADESGESNQ